MKQPILFFFLILFFIVSSCKQSENIQSSYPEEVGDIQYNPLIDDPGFKVCNPNRVAQYYNFGEGLQYDGEMPKIKAYFAEGFKNILSEDESGYLTIRFIVNCEGKTGRFRLQGMNNEYQLKKFNPTLENQLLNQIKQMQDWKIAEYKDKKYDYYQYLTFKIERGKIIDISP